MRIVLLAALSLVVMTTVACQHQRTNPLGTAVASARRELADTAGDTTAMTVKVQNMGSSDLTVYAIPEWGGRIRLGIVPSHADSVLNIPSDRVPPYTKVRFLLDPFGTSEASSTSDEVLITPGDQVTLLLQPGR